jgi:Uma2 family endonuclease
LELFQHVRARHGRHGCSARTGIAEVWIVDLRRRLVDVHRSPSGDGYATFATHGPDDIIALSQAPEISVALRQVLA